MRLGVVRAQAGGLAEFGDHLLRIRALLSEKESEHVTKPGGIRRRQRVPDLRDHNLQVRDGSNRRRQIHRRFELADPLLHLPGAQEYEAKIDVRRRQVRAQCDRSLESLPGAVRLSRHPPGHAQKRIDLGGGGIQADRLFERFHGVHAVAAVPERDAQVVPRFRHVGIQLDRAPETRNGGGEIAFLPLHEAE